MLAAAISEHEALIAARGAGHRRSSGPTRPHGLAAGRPRPGPDLQRRPRTSLKPGPWGGTASPQRGRLQAGRRASRALARPADRAGKPAPSACSGSAVAVEGGELLGEVALQPGAVLALEGAQVLDLAVEARLLALDLAEGLAATRLGLGVELLRPGCGPRRRAARAWPWSRPRAARPRCGRPGGSGRPPHGPRRRARRRCGWPARAAGSRRSRPRRRWSPGSARSGAASRPRRLGCTAGSDAFSGSSAFAGSLALGSSRAPPPAARRTADPVRGGLELGAQVVVLLEQPLELGLDLVEELRRPRPCRSPRGAAPGVKRLLLTSSGVNGMTSPVPCRERPCPPGPRCRDVPGPDVARAGEP